MSNPHEKNSAAWLAHEENAARAGVSTFTQVNANERARIAAEQLAKERAIEAQRDADRQIAELHHREQLEREREKSDRERQQRADRERASTKIGAAKASTSSTTKPSFSWPVALIVSFGVFFYLSHGKPDSAGAAAAIGVVIGGLAGRFYMQLIGIAFIGGIGWLLINADAKKKAASVAEAEMPAQRATAAPKPTPAPPPMKPKPEDLAWQAFVGEFGWIESRSLRPVDKQEALKAALNAVAEHSSRDQEASALNLERRIQSGEEEIAFKSLLRELAKERPDVRPEVLVRAGTVAIVKHLYPEIGFSRQQIRGEAGVGIVVLASPDGLRVTDVYVEGNGLEPGDVITETDGKPLAGIAWEEAVSRVRGPAGSAVSLTVKRKTASAPVVVEARRSIATVAPVRMRIEGNVGVIRLGGESGVGPALDDVINNLQTKRVAGLVIDLRASSLSDGWGEIGHQFLGRQPLGQKRGRQSSKDIFAHVAKSSWQGHVVVLIDDTTSSFAELLASALQHYGMATLVGCATNGKNFTYERRRWDDHSPPVLTHEVISASGSNLAQSRVDPDVLVENCQPAPTSVDDALKEALRRAEWSSWYRTVCRRTTGTTFGSWIGC